MTAVRLKRATGSKASVGKDQLRCEPRCPRSGHHEEATDAIADSVTHALHGHGSNKLNW